MHSRGSDMAEKKKAADLFSTESQPFLLHQADKRACKSSLQPVPPSSSIQANEQTTLPQPPNRPTHLGGFSLPLFGKFSLTQTQPQQQKRKVSAGWLRKLSGHTPTTPTKNSSDNAQLRVTEEKDEGSGELEEGHSKDDATRASDASSSSKSTEKSSEESKTAKEPATALAPKPGEPTVIGGLALPGPPLDQGFDLDDLHRTQKSLLDLRTKFDCGKLKVFESEDALTKMKKVRQQQERLARLHFDLHATYSPTEMYTQTSRTTSLANLKQLMSGLQTLKESIEQLEPMKINADTSDDAEEDS